MMQREPAYNYRSTALEENFREIFFSPFKETLCFSFSFFSFQKLMQFPKVLMKCPCCALAEIPQREDKSCLFNHIFTALVIQSVFKDMKHKNGFTTNRQTFGMIE